LDQLIARIKIGKRLGKIVKEKLRTRQFSARKTVENFPSTKCVPLDWDYFKKSSSLCNVCNTPVLNDAWSCRTCNVMLHRVCSINLKMSKGTSKILASNSRFCHFCEDSVVQDKKYFDKEYWRIKDERKRLTYGRYISKVILTFIIRVRFRKFKKAVTLMQACIRARYERRSFNIWKVKQLRVMVIEILSIPSYIQKGIVTLTLVDPIKQQQVFR